MKIRNIEFKTKKNGGFINIKTDTSITAYKLLRIVLDMSGSVNKYLPQMIALIKDSLKILKNSLGCKIMVSISVFSTNHKVILPFTDIANLDINSIRFPTEASGCTRTGQALLDTLHEIMPYYENLKTEKRKDGIEVYPPVTLLITDGKTYGGQDSIDQTTNLNKYKQAANLIKSYEFVPPCGIDKLVFFACGLNGMLGSASLSELAQLTSHNDRIFTASNTNFLKEKLDAVMYFTLTNTISVI